MGLGSRGGSRHETVKTAGVDPSVYWAFKPGQTVMTVDGWPGRVQAVLDGLVAGNEAYEVVLANGLGGGMYTEGQLRPYNDVTAAHENTASVDYPELSEVLSQRPDIGRYPESTMAMLGSKEAAYYTGDDLRAAAGAGICENGHLQWDGNCASCRNSDDGSNAMVINQGDHRPERVSEVKQSKTAELSEDDKEMIREIRERHARENPPRGDGCTVCGGSGHSTHQHVDDSVVGEINSLFTPEQHAEIKRQPGQPSRYSAWQGDPNDDSPYNPGNYGPECEDCGGAHETHQHKEGSKQALDHGYAMFARAVKDPSFAFHFTAAWKDVRAKARRIRAEGGVHLTEAKNGYFIAQVQGDHGTYESVLMRMPGTQKVGQWDCGCTWAKYHWGAPDDFSRFAGRMCSHVLALNFECQSRGMFGREISTDVGVPSWLGRAASREEIDYAPVHLFAALAVQAGDDLIEVLQALRLVAAVSSPWGDPAPSQVAGPTPGGTSPRDPSANPAQAGFLTSPDPQGWGQQTPGDLADRTAAQATAYDESMFDPEIQAEAVLEPREGWVQMLVPLVRAIAPKLIRSVAPAVIEHEVGKHRGEPEEGEPEEAPPSSDPLESGNEFAKKLKGWTDQSKSEGDRVRAQQSAYSSLHEEPEPALPSTDGAEEEPGQTYSGYAGDPEPDQRQASVLTGVEYATPTDPGSSGASAAPGSNLKSDPTSLEPEDPSFVTTGAIEDIVAKFQATAGAHAIMTSAAPQANDGMDLAAAAKAHLAKTSMADFSPAEQQELIKEGESDGTGASNLDRLEITGTHYEQIDALGAGDDDDQDGWMA